jgi:capsid protein
VDTEIEEENRRADDKGFVFDTDPRKTAKTGVYQETESDD